MLYVYVLCAQTKANTHTKIYCLGQALTLSALITFLKIRDIMELLDLPLPILLVLQILHISVTAQKLLETKIFIFSTFEGLH